MDFEQIPHALHVIVANADEELNTNNIAEVNQDNGSCALAYH